MRVCPRCKTPYPGDETYCSVDGAPTEPAGQAAGPAADANEGKVLGSYRLLKMLGEGGMGKVYLAEHVRLKRRVAIKMLHEQYAMQREVVSRFFGEAQIVNQIHHENIIDISDFVEIDDRTVFFVMELLEGRDLGAEIKKTGAMEAGRVVRIALQVVSALESVHQHKVIHRDLKPDNIFLIDRGGRPDFVKLLDFGIAKLGGAGGEVNHHTQTGMILGTPYYMSPEQAGGTVIDGRSDIYSLGVILYEALTGKVPFRADTYAKILLKHLTEIPVAPHTALPPGRQIPPVLEAAIMRCLEKEPENRYPSMGGLRLDLETALDESLGNATAGGAARQAATMEYVRSTGAAGRAPTPGPSPRTTGPHRETGIERPSIDVKTGTPYPSAATGTPYPGGATGTPYPSSATPAPEGAATPAPGTPYPVAYTNPTMESIEVPRSSAGKWIALVLLGVLALGGGGAAAYFVLGPETFGLDGYSSSGEDDGDGDSKKDTKKDKGKDDRDSKDAKDGKDEVAVADGKDGKDADAKDAKDADGKDGKDADGKDAKDTDAKDAKDAKDVATAVPTPELAKVKFTSTPPGVEVSAGDKILGTTPFETDLPVSPVPLDLRFNKEGRTEATASLVVDGPRTMKAPVLAKEIAAADSPSKKKKKKGSGTEPGSGVTSEPVRPTASPRTAAPVEEPATAKKKDKLKSDVKDPFAD